VDLRPPEPSASAGTSYAVDHACESRGLLLLGGQTDAAPAPRRYPAEDSQTRTFAPARLHTTAAQTNPADSQRVSSAGTNCQKQGLPRQAPRRIRPTSASLATSRGTNVRYCHGHCWAEETSDRPGQAGQVVRGDGDNEHQGDEMPASNAAVRHRDERLPDSLDVPGESTGTQPRSRTDLRQLRIVARVSTDQEADDRTSRNCLAGRLAASTRYPLRRYQQESRH
jgi:hypothetical protein